MVREEERRKRKKAKGKTPNVSGVLNATDDVNEGIFKFATG